jgi:Domain of unknown function (DUF3846)
MATLLKADGTEQEVTPRWGKKFTLEELQKLVGGYIEPIKLPSGYMLVNEDGRGKRLPENALATKRLHEIFKRPVITMLGDCLLVSRKEFS